MPQEELPRLLPLARNVHDDLEEVDLRVLASVVDEGDEDLRALPLDLAPAFADDGATDRLSLLDKLPMQRNRPVEPGLTPSARCGTMSDKEVVHGEAHKGRGGDVLSGAAR